MAHTARTFVTVAERESLAGGKTRGMRQRIEVSDRLAARQIPPKVERCALRRGNRQSVDLDDLIGGNSVAAGDDAPRRAIVRRDQFDRRVIIDPPCAVKSRRRATSDHALSARP